MEIYFDYLFLDLLSQYFLWMAMWSIIPFEYYPWFCSFTFNTFQNKARGPGKGPSTFLSCYYLFEDYIADLANEAAHTNMNQPTDIPDRSKREDIDD